MIYSPRPRHAAFPATVLTLALFAICLLGGQAQAAATPPSFADLAEKLGPTVVNIYTTQTVKARPQRGNPFGNEMEIPEQFRRFFGIPDGADPRNPAPPPQQREMKRTSLGSGVIISKDGYIVTNNHVVENAEEINIRLTNLEEYDAKLIGRDPKTDLALIKIEPKNGLPVAEFGDSEKLRVGDWVLAIGNPFGLEQTVTAGIVSAKGRTLGSTPYENFIQTDASINPGNSGGPLFDLDGRMVGINTAIYSRSGGNIGIGFAIPVKMAENVIGQLKEHGTVVRGWLGVMIQQVTPDLAKKFNLNRPIGALVGEVSPGGPAEKAGIMGGDVIVAYDGKEVTQMSMLPSMVAQTKVGATVNVTVIRDGKNKSLPVTIAKLAEDKIAGEQAAPDAGRDFGITAQELTPELAKSLGIDEDGGVIVADVEPDSPAAGADIHRGDLILEINRQPVKKIQDYAAALEKNKKGESILLLVKRGDHKRFVVLTGK
ncbi:MAG: DegQ family serine endoprotease [Desulfobulbaceae bacterium]|nr:DegQ family serine endoprotease [Desulfobulbaceae bacterium]